MTASVESGIDNGVARLTLNHPPLNILTRDTLRALREECAALVLNPNTRVLVLGARGKHFSAGADVAEHLPPLHQALIPEFLDTVRALLDFPLPVIAAVHGRCLGGAFELVQVADITVAEEGALFGQPEIHLGVFPPAACVTLRSLGPRGLAAELLFTGDPVDAAEARRAGLVHIVAPQGKLEDSVSDLARRIARHSAAALRATKLALRSWTGPIANGFSHVTQIYDNHMNTRDAIEGLDAFLEKRRPQWSHQ